MRMKAKKNLREFQARLEAEHILDFARKTRGEFPESEVYLVGGAVRDAVLGIADSKDYDFVIRNVPVDKLEKFLAGLGDVNLVGKGFGVFKFRPSYLPGIPEIDIALPRTEHSLGLSGGYRDFEIQSDPELPIEIDLSRRDFTVNAIAWKLPEGELEDIFGGLEDLEKKTIRTVGNPEDRFKEDYSRMLRALRFSCQLEFKIERETFETIKRLMPKINDKRQVEPGKSEFIVPRETVAKELLKSFLSYPRRAMEMWDESGAFRELVPELLEMKGCPQPEAHHSEGDVWEHTRLALSKLSSREFSTRFPDPTADAELTMAVLLHDIGKPGSIMLPKKKGDRIRFHGHDEAGAHLAKKICRRLKLSSPERCGVDADEVAWLVKNHMLFMNPRPEKIKNSTLEKYFFNKNHSGRNLLKLGFVDAISTIPHSGRSDLTNFNKILQRIEELKQLSKEKDRLPDPLLSGNEIMKALSLPAGPKIGKLLALLREEQLAGRAKDKGEAIEFLRTDAKFPSK